VQFLITVQHVLNVEVFDTINSIWNVRIHKTLLVYRYVDCSSWCD